MQHTNRIWIRHTPPPTSFCFTVETAITTNVILKSHSPVTKTKKKRKEATNYTWNNNVILTTCSCFECYILRLIFVIRNKTTNTHTIFIDFSNPIFPFSKRNRSTNSNQQKIPSILFSSNDVSKFICLSHHTHKSDQIAEKWFYRISEWSIKSPTVPSPIAPHLHVMCASRLTHRRVALELSNA